MANTRKKRVKESPLDPPFRGSTNLEAPGAVGPDTPGQEATWTAPEVPDWIRTPPGAGPGIHDLPVPVTPASVPSQPLLFEVAWEVCWQLGGIYTVLRSKAPQMTRIWEDRYCLLGPYNGDTASVELEELPLPDNPIGYAVRQMREMGVSVHYGRWLVTGKPQCVLFDIGTIWKRLGEFKYFMWVDHQIACPDDDGEVNNVVVLGFLVSMYLQHVCNAPGVKLPVLAHYHEWMGGLAVMRVRKLGLPVAQVFTTHATLLGRYLCTDNEDFYAKLPSINPDQAAGHYRIYARTCIERGAAHGADVFTTVSDITGIEAEKLLGRKPDVLTPNGLNIQKFAALHEFQNLHKEYKQELHRFVSGHFFPSYHFDLDRTIYLFTSGRYEYNNKGYNLFIESLARLNHWLKAGQVPITVVAFLVTRVPFRSINVDVLKNQSMYGELENACREIKEGLYDNLIDTVSEGRVPSGSDLLTEEMLTKIKRSLHAWRSNRPPIVVTHDLLDDTRDPVLRQLRACNLLNAKTDPVKIVFHPDFVNATSPLIGLDYDQFVRGCHLGVFPSYYEPWGYTPMEAAASGTPAVTSDLAGFGSYVTKNIPDPAGNGLFIVGRRHATFDQAANQLTEYLYQFATKDRRARIELRNRVERLSEHFDWSRMIGYYAEAHRTALHRRTGAG